jgi:tRNA A37 threonylcarbamoyladenosine synthetase subunit TsaC/SUA5/YrdC
VAVIPTDTCYSFVTSITSPLGIRRLIDLKGFHGQRKPLSLLCKDYSIISQYTSAITDIKWVYKFVKSILPGPYTLIFPSSKELPKLVIENKKTSKSKLWKRKEIGIRMPQDPICSFILSQLSSPLLCGSVPQAGEDIIGILHSLSTEQDINDDHMSSIFSEVNYMDDFDSKALVFLDNDFLLCIFDIIKFSLTNHA